MLIESKCPSRAEQFYRVATAGVALLMALSLGML
jgi:hypothetical protein